MRYMLMMNAPRGTGDYAVNAWSPDDLKAHIGFMFALNKELAESGELVGAEGLATPGEAKIVRAGKNGVPRSRTGPSPNPRNSSPATGSWTSTSPSVPTRSPRRRRPHPGPAARRSSSRSRCGRS